MRTMNNSGFLALTALVAALTAANIICARYVSVDRPNEVYLDNSPPTNVAQRPAISSWHVHVGTNEVQMGKLSPAQVCQFRTNTAWFLAAHGLNAGELIHTTGSVSIDVHTPGGIR